jgi:hypothetical protein
VPSLLVFSLKPLDKRSRLFVVAVFGLAFSELLVFGSNLFAVKLWGSLAASSMYQF